MNNFIIITGLIIILLIIIYFIVINSKIREGFTTTTTTTAAATTTTAAATTTTAAATATIPDTIRLDFLSLILINKPFAMYFAKDFVNETNTLPDIFGRADKNAKATGTVTKQQAIGNGATGNIYSISGTKDTKIDFPNNSIPEKFTICSITRYTNDNKKRILISTSDNKWVHGHKDGKRGVVYYNELKTASSANIDIAGNDTDWVSTCAKNEGAIPNNIYINGVASGVKDGGQGNLKLSINNNPSLVDENSEFSLSYLIIWDTILTDEYIKIVADSFTNYLATGQQLLYDISNLSNDDKLKVVYKQLEFLNSKYANNIKTIDSDISKTNIALNTKIEEVNNKIANIQVNSSNINSSNLNSQGDIQAFLAKMVDLESKLKDVNIKTDKIIDLNNDNKNIQSKICITKDRMPEPLEKSFTNNLGLINKLSDIDYEQSKLWCMCNKNNENTPDCVAYSKCKINYDIVKKGIDSGKSFTQLDKIDTDIYNECMNVYKNFPKITTS